MTRRELVASWDIDDSDFDRVCNALDIDNWLGGDTILAITDAGPIDNGAMSDKMCGHNGYYVSTGEWLYWVTNGNPVRKIRMTTALEQTSRWADNRINSLEGAGNKN